MRPRNFCRGNLSDKADTDAEGRWKNAVDNTLFGLVAAGGGAVVHGAVRGAIYAGGKALAWARSSTPFNDMAMQLPVSEQFQQYEKQLTPETRSELHAMRADAEAYQPAYKTTLQGIAQEITGDANNALVPNIKGWDRISQKVVGEENGQASGIRDMVRGAILVKNRDEAERVWQELQTKFTPAENAPRTTLLDGTPDRMGYADLKMNIVGPNSRIYEAQVVTPELQRLKNEEGHKLYEQKRSIEAVAEAAGRAQTVQERAEIAALEAKSTSYYAPALDSFFTGKPLVDKTMAGKRLKEPSENSSKAAE